MDVKKQKFMFLMTCFSVFDVKCLKKRLYCGSPKF